MRRTYTFAVPYDFMASVGTTLPYVIYLHVRCFVVNSVSCCLNVFAFLPGVICWSVTFIQDNRRGSLQSHRTERVFVHADLE